MRASVRIARRSGTDVWLVRGQYVNVDNRDAHRHLVIDAIATDARFREATDESLIRELRTSLPENKFEREAREEAERLAEEEARHATLEPERKRIALPQRVRNAVWQRDQGRVLIAGTAGVRPHHPRKSGRLEYSEESPAPVRALQPPQRHEHLDALRDERFCGASLGADTQKAHARSGSRITRVVPVTDVRRDGLSAAVPTLGSGAPLPKTTTCPAPD